MLRSLATVLNEPPVRPSARVARVARLLDEAPSQVRRMLARGDLQGHKTGKRGVRIYLDSVTAWQEGHPLGGAKSVKPVEKPAPTMTRATRAAHHQAVAHLRDLGLV